MRIAFIKRSIASQNFQMAILSMLCLAVVVLALSACSTMSNLPEKENVKVTREDAPADCKPLGKLEGRSMSKTPKEEEALEDLKKEAANKGANLLVVKQFSGYGTAATGLAYLCP